MGSIDPDFAEIAYEIAWGLKFDPSGQRVTYIELPDDPGINTSRSDGIITPRFDVVASAEKRFGFHQPLHRQDQLRSHLATWNRP